MAGFNSIGTKLLTGELYSQLNGVTSGNFVISSPVTVSTNLTIDAGVSIRCEMGGIITCTADLTINGPFSAGLYQVFSGAGSVTFGAVVVNEVYPEWFDASVNNIQLACNAVNNSGGAGGVVKLNKNTYTPTTTIYPPPRVKIIGESQRASVINTTAIGAVIAYSGEDTFEFCGVENIRITVPDTDTSIGIRIDLPSGYNFNTGVFKNIEIAGGYSGGSSGAQNVGIYITANGIGIVTDNLFDNISITGVDQPIYAVGHEGNFFRAITIGAFSRLDASPRSAIYSTGFVNRYEVRVATANTSSGAIAYTQGGARNFMNLVADFGKAALNITGLYNTVILNRPELLTPIGVYSGSTTLIDSEFVSLQYITYTGIVNPVAGNFTLGAGWGSAATITEIKGTPQRLEFVVNCLGTGQSIYPAVAFEYPNEQTRDGVIVLQITRSGGNSLENNGVAGSASSTGWNFIYAGTPVNGDVYKFVVTM